MDLNTVKQDLVSREFLAVILAGFGNELQPLTGDYGDEPSPKALLPVANKPLIEYTFSWIEQSGIKDVLLICPTIHRPALYHHIHSDVPSSNLHIDLQTYDETVASCVGTCTLLRHFACRIQEDFVLLSCDFISPPSLPLSTLLNRFRADSGSYGSITTTCWYYTTKLDKAASSEEWGPTAPSISIVWDDVSGTLLHIDTTNDLDKNADELELGISMLSKYPRVRLSSNYRDSHVYVCRHSILDALLEKKHLDSFREEFLPWLCKVQYQGMKRVKYGHVLYPEAYAQSSQTTALQHSTLLNTWPLASNSQNKVTASLKVGIVFHQKESGFAVRVDNLYSYVDVNRRSLSTVNYALPTDPKNRSLIDQRAQISADTIIGDSTKISEKTTIKRSIVGRHCIIGKMVKIVGCILLDHCVVEDGAKIDDCVLGKNSKIGAKAELNRCVTQAGYEVNAGDIFKSEKLENTEWTVATGTESDDDSEKSNGDD